MAPVDVWDQIDAELADWREALNTSEDAIARLYASVGVAEPLLMIRPPRDSVPVTTERVE